MQPTAASDLVEKTKKAWLDWGLDLLLILVLALAAYFRLSGVNWDENRHLHPDERFLTMVASAITPVEQISDYFDTAQSSLNPHNRGYGFYVYGTLPLFIVRYVAESLGKAGYDQIHLVGRQLSGIADLMAVFLTFLIANRLYRRSVGLLAAAFAAFSVLNIQLSHYFTVDTFTNLFGYLAVYAAVLVLTEKKKPLANWLAFVLFGLGLGLAAASKVNAVVLAVMLPLAAGIRWWSLPQDERRQRLPSALGCLALATVVSVVVFRICQPYAFSGPGFLGLAPNPKWIANIQELAAQSSGDVDFPPALQWARRPITFAWTNMVKWGLGLPLGLLAWSAFLWMVWRSWRGEWPQHLMLLGWTGAYLTWQSLSATSSMRYQLLIYPALAVIAAWGLVALWVKVRQKNQLPIKWKILMQSAVIVLGVGVMAATLAWAFAFTRIYHRPMTRVEASRWIYQNVPGPINLQIDTGSEIYNQPVAFRAGNVVSTSHSYQQIFRPNTQGLLLEVAFMHIADPRNDSGQKTLLITVAALDQPEAVLAAATLTNQFVADAGDFRGRSYQLYFESPVMLDPQLRYVIQVSQMEGEGDLRLDGPIELTLAVDGEPVYQSLPMVVQTVEEGQPFEVIFAAAQNGQLTGVLLPHVLDQDGNVGMKQLTLTVASISAEVEPFSATTHVSGDFLAEDDGRGAGVSFRLDQPVELKTGRTYSLRLELTQGEGALTIYGSAPALETDWDDALPQPIDAYSPYDFSGGLYQNDLNLQLYWDDNPDKLKRFETTLEQADYLFISSNRQWGTTVRVPERYPLTSLYYRALLGCPPDKEITWCYAVAEPGKFSGVLGYELLAVFQSDPNLGQLRINTQFAEEAFTVYDHPKVFIFKKTANFDITAVQQVLRAVDLTRVVHLTPKKATLANMIRALPFKSEYVAALTANGQDTGLYLLEQVKFFLTPLVQDSDSSESDLLLPEDILKAQQAGGTWSELFNREAIYNRYPGLGAILLYLTLFVLGLVVYPVVRLAFPGLPDRAYPLSRLVGLLLLAYMVWLGGSVGIPFTRVTITGAFIILTVIGAGLAVLQRQALAEEWRKHKNWYLVWELLALAFFVIFLLFRLGNGDLWHPYHGGERPMEFSYLNAVIKSTSFPPYNPWFAGGYINYYYYGFVLVGTLIKWLGIIPSIAFNLVLPALFSMLAMGAFSFGWNLTIAVRREAGGEESGGGKGLLSPAFWFGLVSAVGLLILGNLATVRQIWYGFQRLIVDPKIIENAGFFTRWGWFFEGIGKYISQPGTHLPYPRGDWYWIPSRAIPGEPITEFPAFTFIFSDLHAHMLALPVTVLAIAWALSVLLGRARWGESDGRWRTLSLGLSLLVGGLVIGALYPTNSWDYPTYLLLAAGVLVYTLWRYYQPWEWRWVKLPATMQRIIVVVDALLVLFVLSYLLYLPFWQSFVRPLEDLFLWNGSRTPIWSYITHWGLFLFIIASWFIKETIDWMASTPLSALRKLYAYQGVILGFIVAWFAVVIFLTAAFKVQVAWLVLLMAVWALVLIIRPGQTDTKRLVLFMVGTALVLTLLVEMVALKGDIGRMNMVFKLYMQAWTLLALSAAGGIIWLLPSLPAWERNTRLVWTIAAGVLVFGAALFPYAGGVDKITNRMAEDAPHSLDSMIYMAYATYHDEHGPMDLSQDYGAIRWMQDNIQGSPVILEGNTVEYRWGSRYTVYTGLPGVVGWNWHQRQQRGKLSPEPVTDRVQEIMVFYNTMDPQQALGILKKYAVHYFVVGQLEQNYYPGAGLEKFEEMNGSLWRAVYHDRDTTIYEVLP